MDQTLQILFYNGTNCKCLPLWSSLLFLFLLDELAFSLQCKKYEIWATSFCTLILSHFDLDFHPSCAVFRKNTTSNLFLLLILWLYICKKSWNWTLFIQYVGQTLRKEENFYFPLNLIAFVHEKVFWGIMMPSWFCIHQIYSLDIEMYLLEAYERLGLQHRQRWMKSKAWEMEKHAPIILLS